MYYSTGYRIKLPRPDIHRSLDPIPDRKARMHRLLVAGTISV